MNTPPILKKAGQRYYSYEYTFMGGGRPEKTVRFYVRTDAAEPRKALQNKANRYKHEHGYHEVKRPLTPEEHLERLQKEATQRTKKYYGAKLSL